MTAELFRDNDRLLARFSLEPAAEDEVVSVVGSFNGWTPGVHVLQRASSGSLEVVAEVDHPGDVHFRYLATNGRWFDDESADVIDEFGSTLRRRDTADPLAAAHPDPVVSDTVESAVAPTKKPPAKKTPAKKTAAVKAAPKKATAPKPGTKNAGAKP